MTLGFKEVVYGRGEEGDEVSRQSFSRLARAAAAMKVYEKITRGMRCSKLARHGTRIPRDVRTASRWKYEIGVLSAVLLVFPFPPVLCDF